MQVKIKMKEPNEWELLERDILNAVALRGAEATKAIESMMEAAKPRRKRVYICSRFRADSKVMKNQNIIHAREACRAAADKGYAPYVPHLYLPQCLDDNEPAEREAGLAIGLEFLKTCDELWQWGLGVSEGMAAEIKEAEKIGIPVRVFGLCGEEIRSDENDQ